MSARPYKNRVRGSFDASAHRYERHADYQLHAARRLAERIALAPPAGPILDLGCGTGGLAAALAERGVGVAVACDLAHAMAARTGHRGIAACQADAESLPFADGAFGGVVSGMMLQWVADLPRCFGAIARVLRPGGRLYAATLGPATLNELRQVMDEAAAEVGVAAPLYHPFASTDTIAAALAAAGFVGMAVESRPDRWVYADPFALLRALKGVGAQNAPGRGVAGLGGRRLMERFARRYAERYADPLGVVATYETIFVTATRP